MSTTPALAVTRIVNSCTLLEFGDRCILADPWFRERWHLHRGEGLGCPVDALPALTAIVGSHFVANHWDIGTLGGAQPTSTAVITSSRRMTRQARRAGFSDVQQLAPGDRVELEGGIRIEAIAAGAPFGMANNSYVVDDPTTRMRVFVGGEARDLAPIRAYRETAPPVDVALLPVNGLHVVLGPRLVMDAPAAVEAAGILGARTLVPIHDAHARDFPYAFVRRLTTAVDARAFAAVAAPRLDVVLLHTGVRWESAAARSGVDRVPEHV